MKTEQPSAEELAHEQEILALTAIIQRETKGKSVGVVISAMASAIGSCAVSVPEVRGLILYSLRQVSASIEAMGDTTDADEAIAKAAAVSEARGTTPEEDSFIEAVMHQPSAGRQH